MWAADAYDGAHHDSPCIFRWVSKADRSASRRVFLAVRTGAMGDVFRLRCSLYVLGNLCAAINQSNIKRGWHTARFALPGEHAAGPDRGNERGLEVSLSSRAGSTPLNESWGFLVVVENIIGKRYPPSGGSIKIAPERHSDAHLHAVACGHRPIVGFFGSMATYFCRYRERDTTWMVVVGCCTCRVVIDYYFRYIRSCGIGFIAKRSSTPMAHEHWGVRFALS